MHLFQEPPQPPKMDLSLVNLFLTPEGPDVYLDVYGLIDASQNWKLIRKFFTTIDNSAYGPPLFQKMVDI